MSILPLDLSRFSDLLAVCFVRWKHHFVDARLENLSDESLNDIGIELVNVCCWHKRDRARRCPVLGVKRTLNLKGNRWSMGNGLRLRWAQQLLFGVP